MLEGAQPDRVLGELVDLAIERRVKRGGDAAMDPTETPSSPVSDEEGRALAEKASVFLQQWLMLRVAIVVAKKRGSPERRLGEQYNQQVPCQRKSASQQRWQRKGEGKFENKGKGKDKGGNVGVASTALLEKGGAKGSPPRQRHHHSVPHSSPSLPRDGSRRSPIKRQWTMAPSWWRKSPSPDRAQVKGGNGGSSGSGNNRKGQRW